MYKVLVVGDVRVGKTSFVHRLVNNTFKENYKCTLGVDFALKTLELENGQSVKVQLWDIAGHERATTMTRVYYKGASACVLMLDITDRSTFQNCARWKQDLDAKVFLHDDKPIPCFLLANKSDLSEQREVFDQEIKRFATENNFVGWMLCSVKENRGVNEGMRSLISSMLQRCNVIATSADEMSVSIDPQGEKKYGICCGSS